MPHRFRYLLLQVRNPDDPMAEHEIQCFSRVLNCNREKMEIVDLLRETPGHNHLEDADVVLLGGSGDYSVAEGGPWMEPALDMMRELHARSKPTFASCWGFQAMARALGGVVVTDMSRAEIGTHRVRLTKAGHADPVFGPLGSPFMAQMGHQDIVESVPDDAIVLASTDRVTNQAFRFVDKPIYCTQFHPELTRVTLLDRLERYPRYLEKILGISFDEFVANHMHDSEPSEGILRRFVRSIAG